MGCVSSTLLHHDDDFPQIGASAAFSHHIVSLTSTTYGLLTLDPPPSDSPAKTTPQPQPRRVTLGSLFPTPLSEPRSTKSQPLETINSWDLMSGLDSDNMPSFRFTPSKSLISPLHRGNEENVSPKPSNISSSSDDLDKFLGRFEMLCPPNAENKVVMYTTTLRSVRKTFEDCNAVRSAVQGLGILFCERDISMDRGFRDELRDLMKGKGSNELIPPRLFVKGRYIGGVEEVMKIVEEGHIGELVQGLPKLRSGYTCEGCGGVGFLPCCRCHGSCKMVTKQGKKTVTLRCSDCNENGLVLCPICS